MDWETYKTNFNESFEVDGNTGFVKMDVIQGHCFKVGSLIFFLHRSSLGPSGYFASVCKWVYYSLPEEPTVLPSLSPSSHTRGVGRVLPHSSKVMEGKPEVTPVTPDHLYMEI